MRNTIRHSPVICYGSACLFQNDAGLASRPLRLCLIMGANAQYMLPLWDTGTASSTENDAKCPVVSGYSSSCCPSGGKGQTRQTEAPRAIPPRDATFSSPVPSNRRSARRMVRSLARLATAGWLASSAPPHAADVLAHPRCFCGVFPAEGAVSRTPLQLLPGSGLLDVRKGMPSLCRPLSRKTGLPMVGLTALLT